MELNWNPEQLGKGKIVVKIDKRMNGSYILEKKGKVLGFNLIASQNDKEFCSAYIYIYIHGDQEQEIKFQANVSEALCNGVFASDNNTDGVLAREVKKKALNCFSRL